MVFSSVSFIFFFLPAVVILYYILPGKFRLLILTSSSLLFYFFGEAYMIWVMLATTLIDYFCGLMITGGIRKKGISRLPTDQPRTSVQRFWLLVSIISNLLLLGYFKYFNFFTDNFIALLDLAGLDHKRLDNIARVGLPIGISFYTFQSMSYTIDVYRGEVAVNRSLLKFATFVTMFPQLVAGPIVRYSEVEKQLHTHSFSTEGFVLGLQRFVIGLAKKVLIANTMASVADKVFAIDGPGLSTGLAWIGLIAYTLQIYFDFSGYSCMAVGLGRMLGFDFPENFNYPYVSRSIRAFWQRWHISLSTWFRDYLYIPLGGSRHGSIRTYLNLFIVFLICGLWHGASWNFVVWGLFHGFFLVAERMAIGKWLGFLPMFISRSYVILVVMVGWVFFRTDDLSHAFEFIKVLFGSKSNGHHLVAEYMYADTWILMAAGILFSMPVVPHLLTFVNGLSGRRSFLVQTAYMLSLFILFLFCVMDLVSGSYNPFIYFRF